MNYYNNVYEMITDLKDSFGMVFREITTGYNQSVNFQVWYESKVLLIAYPHIVVKLLSKQEIDAIVCHEVGHLRGRLENPDIRLSSHAEEMRADRYAVRYYHANPLALVKAIAKIEYYCTGDLNQLLYSTDTHPSTYRRCSHICSRKNIYDMLDTDELGAILKLREEQKRSA